MSADESLKQRRRRGGESVRADAIDWGSHFVKFLELEYTNAAARLSAEATWADYRRTMFHAVVAALRESGTNPDEIAQLLREGIPLDHDVDQSAGWTSECNARRIALIDKKIQQTLSEAEAAELDRLTARLRLHVDNEELVPMKGARRLHRQLLETDNSRSVKG
ncbi:MAG: hypothetical protein FJ276_03530 [Planctomycetes bacterium]|nr:hypothetical protein [Planctomycetota bacterium]